MTFGAPQKETRTINVSEFIITGGSEPLDEDSSYSISDIQKGLEERKARLAKAKEKKATTTPAANTTTEKKKIDLGF